MASVLSTIETDIKKFFAATGTDLEKFGNAFEQIFKKVPSALQTVENFVGEVAPVVEAAVALADPIAEAPVAAVLATVETGLAAIQATATAANSGNSLLANLQNFASTVPSLLTGLDIKDAALTAKITSLVSLVTNEAKVLIPAVEAWVQQIASKPAA
jgi:phage-related protein